MPIGSACPSSISCADGSGAARTPGCACCTRAPNPDPRAASVSTEVAATLDGFELAEVDLRQRREGDVLGVSQSGRRSGLNLLSVLRDQQVIEQARAGGRSRWWPQDPTLQTYPALAAAIARWGDQERLAYVDKD